MSIVRWACFPLVLLSVAFGVLTSGCGGGDAGVKVSGSVTMKSGSPASVVASFIPSDSKLPIQSAFTDAGGRFETNLLPGKYSVVLSKKVDSSGNVPGPDVDVGQLPEGALSEAIPTQYTDRASTPLSAEIPAGGADLPPFVVEGE
jgi:hypothetical protein